MAVISTDIGPSSAGAGFADRGLDVLVSPESVTRLPSPVGSEFDSETKLVQDVGSRLYEYETTNKQLHADLLDAANEKQRLVDALRDLHGQFHALQRHADEQRETLVSEGEALRACRQRIALLQKELVAIRADHERSAKQQDVNETSRNAGKYEYVVASYRDALRELRRKLARHQAALAAQKKAHSALLRTMQSLEERAEEFEGQQVQYARAEAELRKYVADREKQIARMNKYIIRMQRELKLLNDGLHSQDFDASVSDSRRGDIGHDSVSPAEAPQEPNSQPVSPRTPLTPAIRPDVPKRGSEEVAAEPLDGQQLPQQFVIVPLGDETAGAQYPLHKNILTVGRSPENDIPLRDTSISRFHARIIVEESGVIVEDLGSTNGLVVNAGHKKRHVLNHGDRFGIGRVEFELVDLAIRASGLCAQPV